MFSESWIKMFKLENQEPKWAFKRLLKEMEYGLSSDSALCVSQLSDAITNN